MVVRTEAGSLPNDAVVLPVFGELHFVDRNSSTDYLRLWKKLPPRMRGKVFPVSGALWSSRITPAYAGKSKSGHELIADTEDHPRVCGEKAGKENDAVHNEGSPPRMRGKGTTA